MEKFKSPEKILPENDPKFNERVDEWKCVSDIFEKNNNGGYDYPAGRVEGETVGKRTLESYHQESFVEYISKELRVRQEIGLNVPMSILDLGGGAGLFAEQLRKKFGNKVIVYTTGLRKKSAVELRKVLKGDGGYFAFSHPKSFDFDSSLHKNDLKWRSIVQLSAYPEFDLIIDTAGEFVYSPGRETPEKNWNTPNQSHPTVEEAMQEEIEINHKFSGRTHEYLQAVITKLLPGGRASIAFISRESVRKLSEEIKKFEKIAEFQLIKNTYESKAPEYILKIVKKLEQDKSEINIISSNHKS